jgi:succinate dehydrogenase flavin-adding protein (antitoxin of CptAB toxin-antitoxin module)
VSARGLEEYRRIIAARSEFHATIMRNMSRAECREFDRLLKKLATELLHIQAQGDDRAEGA